MYLSRTYKLIGYELVWWPKSAYYVGSVSPGRVLRAVYRQAELYLLDDILASVDANVGANIFHHVIGPEGIVCFQTLLTGDRLPEILSDIFVGEDLRQYPSPRSPIVPS